MASAKALGKRKMTLEQIQIYYMKQQKTECKEEDSDDEAQNLHVEVPTLSLSAQNGVFRPYSNSEPLDIHPEDEHARDLLEALNRPTANDFTIDSASQILCSEDIRDRDVQEIHGDVVISRGILDVDCM